MTANFSLWKNGRHSLDYQFQDRRVFELFNRSGVGCFIHKYCGPASSGAVNDATQPTYTNQSVQNIEDILFLENRDRLYDPDIYRTKILYTMQDSEFNLSQFGLFLQNGTIFISFHLTTIVDMLGRKPLSGDVIELPHLKEFYSLDSTVPVALQRFYVIQDAYPSTESYGPTWWPHCWKARCTPLVDAQEYSQILNEIASNTSGQAFNSLYLTDTVTGNLYALAVSNSSPVLQTVDTPFSETYPIILKDQATNQSVLVSIVDGAVTLTPTDSFGLSAYKLIDQDTGNIFEYFISNNAVSINSINDSVTISNITSTYDTFIQINDAIIERSEQLVPQSGYNTDALFAPLFNYGDTTQPLPPGSSPTTHWSGYLVGNGEALDGYPVTGSGINFPEIVEDGEYFLRTDYLPNRLFRYNAQNSVWCKVNDSVRTSLTPGSGQTQRDSFINNTSTFTDSTGNIQPSRQNLSSITTGNI